MSKINTAEDNFLKLFFQNVAWASVGDASGLQPSATAGNVYVSLHTADPGETGDQTTSEISYTGYARVAVARSSGNWAVSSSVCDNVNVITFGKRTNAGTAQATYFGLGYASSGAGVLYMRGALTTALDVGLGVTPEFAAGALDVTED